MVFRAITVVSGCIERYLRYCVIYNKNQYNYNIHIPGPLDLPGVSSQRPLVIEDDRGKTYWNEFSEMLLITHIPSVTFGIWTQLQVGTTWLYTLQTETHGQESKWWLFDGWLIGCLIASLDSDPQLHILPWCNQLISSLLILVTVCSIFIPWAGGWTALFQG